MPPDMDDTVKRTIERCAQVADDNAAVCDRLARYYERANNGARENNAETSARVSRVIAAAIRALPSSVSPVGEGKKE